MTHKPLASTDLSARWTLSAAGPEVPDAIAAATIPAEVPGSAHVDLLRAGLIPDPYLGQNEEALEWAWRTTWTYSTVFDSTPAKTGERVDLDFEGLDTVAAVILNGTEVAHTFNMHRTYRFDVGAILRDGENDLTVRFDSSLDYAEAVEASTGPHLHVRRHPFNEVRKMACSFGWDWGPDLQTAGIWRPVRLERWSVARLKSVRPLVTLDRGIGRVEVRVEVEQAEVEHAGIEPTPDAELTVIASIAGIEAKAVVASGSSTVVVALEAPDVETWWPVGYGTQPLYDLSVDLRTGDDLLDSWRRRVGFRSIEVDTAPDEIGAPFTFIVNGVPVFIKGANWIPDDHLLTRVTRERLRRRFTQALDANINLLRVWGGGIYESDDFYELADEMGLMVWQDLLFACAAYDEGPVLRSEIEAEVTDNVTRLMPHPSLVLWNGSNENIWGFFQWGWNMLIPDENWGLGYYIDVLPRLLTRLDPTRPYTPSSPFSPHHAHTDLSPNDPNWGTVHEWKVWNSADYSTYRDYVPRFVSEFGFQGPATWATIVRTLPKEDLHQDHPAWLAHQKADFGNEKLNWGLEAHLPIPRDFEAWHWATQLNQARAVAFGIEHYRSHWPRCAGTIVWQLNDCWPVTSWAAIDGDERKKPLWYSLRHAYSPRLLTFQPRDGNLHLIAINDTSEEWDETVTLRRMMLDGTKLGAATLEFAVPARGVATLELPADVGVADDPSREVLAADVGHPGEPGHARAIHTWLEDKDLAYESAPFVATALRTPKGCAVTLLANGFVRDVAILVDKVHPDSEAADALVTLLPGETATIDIACPDSVDPRNFLAEGVLITANWLVGTPSPTVTRS